MFSNVAVTSRSILIIVQIITISCGNIELSNNKVSGVVGGNLDITWKLNLENNEKASFTILQVCQDTQYNYCYAQGSGINFQAASNTLGGRIKPKYQGGTYTLTIKNLNVTDTGRTFHILAVFNSAPGVVTNTAAENVTIQVNAYPKLLFSLESALYFNKSDDPTVTILAFGIPNPTVKWIFGDQTATKDGTDLGNYEYEYKLKMLPLTIQDCGQQLQYTISGWKNSVIEKASTIYVIFTPDQPVVTVTGGTEERLIVSWGNVKPGQCSVSYTVDVLDKLQNVIKSIQTTEPPVDITFSSKEERRNAIIIKVTASYQGLQSSSEMNITFVPIPTPTTTKKRSSANESTGTGNVTGALMGGLVAGVILGIIMTILSQRFIKKKREGVNERSSTQTADYDNVIVQGRGTSGVNSPESNYTSLNMSNLQASNYMELQSS